MDVFRVEGPTRLLGEVCASGAKNAALPILAATLLTDEPVVLENVPRVADVANLASLLSSLGTRVGRLPDSSVRVETVNTAGYSAPEQIVRRMRASFCVLGPLLARRGKAIVPLPGGCNLGARPVDLHLKGMTALGAEIRVARGRVVAVAKQLRGATIDLSGPRGSTVTGTANVMSAAVLAEGKTTILGAATEPEIVDLGTFLNQLGAEIFGLGTNIITIRGVRRLSGGTYRIMSDRIETATFLIAGAITRGHVTVQGARPDHLQSTLVALEQLGAKIETGPNYVTLDATAPCSAQHFKRETKLVAGPYPALPTDIQAPLSALCSILPGRQTIHDSVFPDRFAHVAALKQFGAQVRSHDGRIEISGPGKLVAANVNASDLRAGAGLVLAALAAHGTTIVRGIQHIDRGYEAFEKKLAQLGARVERIDSLAADARSHQLGELSPVA